jgi:hypothetical protein
MDEVRAPVREVREIDYTDPHWGHSLAISSKPDGTLSGFCWNRSPVGQGDLLRWRTAYGVAIGSVTESRWFADPGDMYAITVEIVGRIPNPSLAPAEPAGQD